MSLIILTKAPRVNIFSREFYVGIIKKILKKRRGPDVVVSSLTSGLKELNFNFKLNPKIKDIDKESVVFVNNSIEALKWAIGEKKQGKIKKLIAGPNLVISPTENNRILADSAVDKVMVPSIWVFNFYASEIPELTSKLVVWAAGIEIPKENNIKIEDRKICLVYKKNVEGKIFTEVIDCLKSKKIPYKIINYGSYSKKDYFDLLAETKFLIYLQKSESQGMALLEAWSFGVPTLVLNRDCWEYGDYKWCDQKINAPYLTKECGMFFDANHFEERLCEFVDELSNFRSRKYASDNFTNKICTEKFLELRDYLW